MLRFVAAVMTTSGVLLLLDAGLTVAWQEPVSAVLAHFQQAELEGALAAEPTGRDELSERELRERARRHEERVSTGEAWGRIELSTLDRDFVVVEGTDQETLRKGPGHYPETSVPGMGTTTAIAGHRTTYLAPFRNIDRLEEGDPVVLELPWARFRYEVEEQEIVARDATEVVRDVGRERLVLSACHPLYSAAQRVIVYAALKDVSPR